MRFRLAPRKISSPLRNAGSWVQLLVIVVIVVLARLVVPSRNGATLPGLVLPTCPLRSYTGLPCPFCGITTGTAWMARGQVLNAWHSNILSPFLGIFLLSLAAYTLGCRLIAGYSFDIEMNPRVRRGLTVLATVLVLLSWGVNLYRL